MSQIVEVVEYTEDVRRPEDRVVLGALVSNGGQAEFIEAPSGTTLNLGPTARRHVELILQSIRAKLSRGCLPTPPSAQVAFRHLASGELPFPFAEGPARPAA